MLGENSRVSCVLFRSYASSVLVWPKDGDALGIARQRTLEPEVEYSFALKLHAQRLFRTRLRPRA